MEIYIRISPNISPTAVKGWAKDKEEMISVCHASLLGVGGYTADKHYILDNCPDKWADFFKMYGKVTKIIQGNSRDSFSEVLRIAYLEGKDEHILFLEDDYLWQNDARLERLDRGLQRFGLVIPYDHPDHYKSREHHELVEFDNLVYRMCRTATHTFAVTRTLFLERFETFNHGRHDWEMWTKQNIEGVYPWSPVYGFCTHLAEGHIGLNYNYKELYDGYRDNMAILEGKK